MQINYMHQLESYLVCAFFFLVVTITTLLFRKLRHKEVTIFDKGRMVSHCLLKYRRPALSHIHNPPSQMLNSILAYLLFISSRF